jgi:hypothetical protein
MRAQPIARLSAPELPPQIDASLPAPSWQRHLRHDPAVETLRDRGLRFAANSADAGSRNLDCDIAAGVTGLFDG